MKRTVIITTPPAHSGKYAIPDGAQKTIKIDMQKNQRITVTKV